MIVVLQLIGFAFSLTMIYFALLHYRKNTLNGTEMFAWVSIWGMAIFVIAFPDIFRTFSSTYLVTRLFDLLVVLGIAVFSVISSISYIRTRKTQNKIDALVRELSIKDAKKNEKAKSKK